MASVSNTTLDPTIDWVQIEVDEKQYHLCYSFNAICQAESVTKCNLLSGMWTFVTDRQGITAEQLRGLLYASLQKAHPEMSLQAAGDLIRLDTFAGLEQAVSLAYLNSLPAKKKQDLLKSLESNESSTEPKNTDNSGSKPGASHDNISDSQTQNSTN